LSAAISHQRHKPVLQGSRKWQKAEKGFLEKQHPQHTSFVSRIVCCPKFY